MKSKLPIGLVILLTATGLAYGRQLKLATELMRIDRGATADVIIQFRDMPTQRHHAKVWAKGGVLRRELRLVKGGLYRVPARALADLANDPDVAYISPNRPVAMMMDMTDAAVNASAAWQSNLDGTGIGIAIIDSGVSNHTDLRDSNGISRVVYSQDFVGGGTDDLYGHGTHVAGIAAGNGYDSTCPTCNHTFKGVAPNANIINLRVLDQNGSGFDSNIIDAINQAIALKDTYNIRVISISVSPSGGRCSKAIPWIPCAKLSRRRGKLASWWWLRQVTTAGTTSRTLTGTAPSPRPEMTPTSLPSAR